jgi:uncharacterized protein (DUF697 family)
VHYWKAWKFRGDIVTEREQEARDIIKAYLGWSFCAGLIPVPGVDLAALTALHVNMIRDIGKIYDVPLKRAGITPIVSALVGAVIPTVVADSSVSSMVKGIPVIGTALGMAVLPGLSTAATYAVGRVFIQHFELGGNFFNFDPAALRNFFKSEFEAARKHMGKEAAPASA